jgi:hypothetical protein
VVHARGLEVPLGALVETGTVADENRRHNARRTRIPGAHAGGDETPDVLPRRGGTLANPGSPCDELDERPALD